MRRPMRHFLTLFACLIASFILTLPSRAATVRYETAPQARPAWSVAFTGPVVWQRVTPLGSLLVATASGVHGVDPERGRTAWSHANLGSFDEAHYEEIEGTPLVALADGDERPRVVVLNAVDGTIVFDSLAANLSMVLSKHVLPRSHGLLIFGFPQGSRQTAMLLYDGATGKHLWTNSDLMPGMGAVMATFLSLYQAQQGMSGVTGDPVEISGDAFLIGTLMQTMCVNTRTGATNWAVKNPNDIRLTRFYRSAARPDVVFVGNETGTGGATVYSHYAAHRLKDGGGLWAKPARIKGPLNDVIFHERGMIVSPRTDGSGMINLLDYASGRPLWGKGGKGIPILGGIIDHDATGAGLLLTTGYDSAWTKKGTVYYLNVLDVDAGALRFKKPIKLEGRIVSTEVLDRGVLYVTSSEADILDPRTGASLLPRPVTSKNSLVTGRHGRDLYLFSQDDGALYRIDTARAVAQKISQQPVRLEEDAAPLSLEAGGDAITLVSSQNVIVFGPDGSVRVKAYHPSPRLPALTRALLRAESFRAGMAAAASGLYGGAFASAAAKQPDGSADRAVTASLAQGFGGMADEYASLSGSYAAAARARFKASAQARDFVFMMVQFTRTDYGLAKVSKTTGEVLSVINLGRDKTPVYEVDGVDNRIYYRPVPAQIVGYRF